MMLVPTYVAKSGIEGVGIFAAAPIAKGAPIWQFDAEFDRVLPKAALDAYPDHVRDFITRYSYRHHDDESLIVLEMDNGRFMNHSEAPNTDFTPQTVAYALRDIAPGEEITCNYCEFDPTFSLLPSPEREFARPRAVNGHGRGRAKVAARA
ncbi:MAG: SET domain-containing protein-lysine N-methyltransferase [Alphaproteobacteria bacterium]|nr:SET domain-containing protein-lysine N-methyltransferase [Alphaproteobacteria bacterium]